MEEVWKECGESKERIYEISNLGNVKSISKSSKKEKILNKNIDKIGYLRVHINGKYCTIHSLVAYAFLGERPLGHDIDHVDRNKNNNRVDNLRYCTKSENCNNREISKCFCKGISEEDLRNFFKWRLENLNK